MPTILLMQSMMYPSARVVKKKGIVFVLVYFKGGIRGSSPVSLHTARETKVR